MRLRLFQQTRSRGTEFLGNKLLESLVLLERRHGCPRRAAGGGSRVTRNHRRCIRARARQPRKSRSSTRPYRSSTSIQLFSRHVLPSTQRDVETHLNERDALVERVAGESERRFPSDRVRERAVDSAITGKGPASVPREASACRSAPRPGARTGYDRDAGDDLPRVEILGQYARGAPARRRRGDEASQKPMVWTLRVAST